MQEVYYFRYQNNAVAWIQIILDSGLNLKSQVV